MSCTCTTGSTTHDRRRTTSRARRALPPLPRRAVATDQEGTTIMTKLGLALPTSGSGASPEAITDVAEARNASDWRRCGRSNG